MAKIIIYEDNLRDAMLRYQRLTPQHEVHIRYLGRGTKLQFDFDREELSRSGFNPDNIKAEYGTPKKESTDIYFLDGMLGHCFNIIKNLPRSQAFINSSDPLIIKEAKEKGFNVVEREAVEAIVERVIKDIRKREM